MSAHPGAISLNAIPGIPSIKSGDDLAQILGDAMIAADLEPRAHDVLVISQKIVSKAENRWVKLAEVTPSEHARELATRTEKDPRLVEVILRESRAVLRHRLGLLICETRLGMVMANAGVDHSNVGPVADSDEAVLLLPLDPDASSDGLRQELVQRFGVELGVVLSDSAGRAWRTGVVGLALGVSGVPSVVDLRGRQDRDGRRLEVTQVGYADEIASAAALVMGEADESRPAVLVRGLLRYHQPVVSPPAGVRELIRAREDDLFR